MAIYRPPKPRWPLAIGTATAGLLIGLVTGLLVGERDPEIGESVPLLRTQLFSAAGALEVAAIEYRESVEDGRVIRQAEYDGARSALKSSRAKYAAVRSALESLVPSHVSTLDALYDEAEELIERRASSAQVGDLLTRLEGLLSP